MTNGSRVLVVEAFARCQTIDMKAILILAVMSACNGLSDLLAEVASPSDARQAPYSNTQISPGVPDCLKDLFDIESPTEFQRNQRQRTSLNPMSPLSSNSSLHDSEEEYDELDHVSVNLDDKVDPEDHASNDEDHFSD